MHTKLGPSHQRHPRKAGGTPCQVLGVIASDLSWFQPQELGSARTDYHVVAVILGGMSEFHNHNVADPKTVGAGEPRWLV